MESRGYFPLKIHHKKSSLKRNQVVAVSEKHIESVLFCSRGMFILQRSLYYKLVAIQFVEGDKYRELATLNTTP